MPTNLEIMQEAVKRGIPLPPDKQAMWDEALKRGLVQDPNAGVMDRIGGDLKAFGEGAKNTTVGLLNAGNDMARAARDKIASMMGITPEELAAADAAKSQFGIGTPQRTETALSKVEQATGKHVARNREERYMQSFGDQVPGLFMGGGSIPQRIAAAIGGGAGAEFAGEQFQGSKWQPLARMAGNVIGASIPDIARRILTPFPANPDTAAAARTLDAEGVPTTAGQRTGSRGLRMAEEELGGGLTQQMAEQQQRNFTAAAARRLGIDANQITPQVVRQINANVDNTFRGLASRTNLPLDNQLQNDLLDVVTLHGQSGAGGSGPEDIMNEIAQIAGQNGGVLPGEAYQNITRRLRELADANPAAMAGTVRRMRDALDSSIERNIDPALRTAWRQARQQYADQMILQDALTKPGANTAAGLISPAQLRSSVDAHVSDRHILSGDSSLGNLANAGVVAIPKLPNSATAQRQRLYQLLAGGAAAIGGALGAGTGTIDPMTAIYGTAGAAALPLAAGRALMSRPGQAIVGNQLFSAPGLSMADKVTKALSGENPALRDMLLKLLEGNNNGS